MASPHAARPVTTVLAGLVTAVLLLVGAPATAAPAPGYAAQAHTATNAERAQRDLVTLRKNDCLTRLAKQQARRMAERRELFHQDLGKVIRQCDLSRAGENVAYGYPTGKSVVAGWMGSKGHRANILAPAYRLMGIGAVKRGGTWYAAQVFGAR